jgi:hypothetical protein
MKSKSPIGGTGTAPAKLPAQKFPGTAPLGKAGGAPSTIGKAIPVATKSTPAIARTAKAHGDQPQKHDAGSRGFK